MKCPDCKLELAVEKSEWDNFMLQAYVFALCFHCGFVRKYKHEKEANL